MKQMCKKLLTIMLAAASVLSFSCLAVNASEVHKYEYTSVDDAANNNHLYCYLHYYYDSSNASILTKVAAISDFVCNNGAALLTEDAPVYLYNSVDVTYSTGAAVRRTFRTDPIYIDSSVHVGESKMYQSPLTLSTALRTKSVVARHGLCTYIASAHPASESSSASYYPVNGERQIYFITQTWQ